MVERHSESDEWTKCEGMYRVSNLADRSESIRGPQSDLVAETLCRCSITRRARARWTSSACVAPDIAVPVACTQAATPALRVPPGNLQTGAWLPNCSHGCHPL